MMKLFDNRKIKAISAIVIPLLAGLIISLITLNNQPLTLNVSSQESKTAFNYIDPDKLYMLSGYFDCYPKEHLFPAEVALYSNQAVRLGNLNSLFSDLCYTKGNYSATICFALDVPANASYGLILPGLFCEYKIYSNSEEISSSASFLSKTPIYSSPRYIELPMSEDGHYDILINLNTPTTFSTGKYDNILFGTSENIEKRQALARTISLAVFSFAIITIVFCVSQMNGPSYKRQMISFIIMCAAGLMRILISDDVLLIAFIPNLNYQVGVFIRGIALPFFLLSLMYHEYTTYQSCFPRKLLILGVLTQIIPFLDALTFSSVEALSNLAEVMPLVPYIICFYVWFRATKDNRHYTATFGFAISTFAMGAEIDFLTHEAAIPARYTYAYGIIVFSIIETLILARTYAAQEESERLMTDELNATLAQMQSSENAFLNAQMKPHFLYNTLNTIADLCVTDPEKAQSLIASLKDYLSMVLNLDNMGETVPFSHELKLAKTYANIEKERFPSISFYYDMPIRLPQIDMPPLVLQPLVENAIKHGVRKLDRPGIITIRVREEKHTGGSSIIFQVSDNGIGMDAQTIEKLFAVPLENKSIGIYNIDKRLKNLYGKGLHVESTKGLGTCISFVIDK